LIAEVGRKDGRKKDELNNPAKRKLLAQQFQEGYMRPKKKEGLRAWQLGQKRQA